MKPTTSEAITGCLTSVIFLLLTPFFALYHGWALWKLWGWFALPSMGMITWHEAVGLCCLLWIIRMRSTTSSPDDKGLWRQVFMAQAGVALSVLFGWILHLMGFGHVVVEVVS